MVKSISKSLDCYNGRDGVVEPVPVILLVIEQHGKRQFLERIEIHDGNYLLGFLCCLSIQQLSKHFRV